MSRSLAVPLVVVALALGAGCSSAKADFEKFCNAPELSGAASLEEASEKQERLTEWLVKNLRGSEVRETIAALVHARPDDRNDLIKAAARKAGYLGPCPMAESR